jgi:hypothetical protein
MTGPQQSDDLTDTDNLVQNTGNGPAPDDPGDEVSQDPGHLPEGTETGSGS